MADLGISVAAQLIEVVGGEIIKKVCDMWDCKSQLEELKENVSTIQKVLLVVEAKRELPNEEERDYLEKLKDAVYDADDLFDEFLTLAELKKLTLSRRSKFYAKVRCFFSCRNQVGQAYRMSREIQNIMTRIDVVANNHRKFGFDFHYKPIVSFEPISTRGLETHSYVLHKDVIGRDKDKEVIFNMLLDPNDKEEGPFVVSIVGVGGLGKTTIAQIVYNDENVKQKFPTRIWVCVSDEGENILDAKVILCKILELVTGKKFDSTPLMEFVQQKFQEELRGKKYLLVLDDVWNEDHELWLNLEKFLMLGHGGSRIVVTTRSKTTAYITGSKYSHELKGLSKEHSQKLFELMAFSKGHDTQNYQQLAGIGEKIVENCHGSPLAIRVVGSLLFGQDISKWRSFQDIGLAEIRKGNNAIISVLKLSYHNLAPSLKACFTYSAVFPKDYIHEKEHLISLWIANGFIVPLDVGQCIEDAAEEHFSILLQRCFFEQEETIDIHGEVYLFIKIHDLLHDVAKEVARGVIHVVNSITNNLEDKVRHVSYTGDGFQEINSIGGNKIRSLFCWCKERPFVVDTYIEKWMCLRVLCLSGLGIINLPSSIGKLLHLRYLNLSNNNNLVKLPNVITRLHNLQTLLIRGCHRLTELPKDFCRLVKLRHFDLEGCHELSCMPSGMDKLTSLTVLPFFVVGRKPSQAQSEDDELKALKYLTEIKGELFIEIGEHYRRTEGMDDSSEGYLKSMKHLTGVGITFNNNPGRCIHDESALEILEPHSNLKQLSMYNYNGRTIPRWGRAVNNSEICLSQLVSIYFYHCSNLQEMPILSKLPYLKSFRLCWIDKLEYMEKNSGTESATFFPSLQILGLHRMKELKGWWEGDDVDYQRFIFPRLFKLEIGGCPNLKSLPPCPSLEELNLTGSEKIMLWKCLPQSLCSLSFNTCQYTSLPEEIQHFTSLQIFKLQYCVNLKALPDCISSFSSLQELYISDCPALKSLPEAVRNLTSLQRLTIRECPYLAKRCRVPNGEDYPNIQPIPDISLTRHC